MPLFNKVLLFAVVRFPGIIFPFQGKVWFIVVFLISSFDFTDSYSEVVFLFSTFYCMAFLVHGSYYFMAHSPTSFCSYFQQI